MPAEFDTHTFVLPPDYTFTPGGILIHKDSYKRLMELLEEAKEVFPNESIVFVTDDIGYEILDLVDMTLSSIHTFVLKKRWFDAWHACDALAKFEDMHYEWTTVDDGEHVALTERAYGALLVKTIRALDLEGKFTEEYIPDIGYSLRDMAVGAEALADTLDCCYHRVLKAYGKKLFGSRTEEDRKRIAAARKKAYETFVQNLSPEEREKRGDVIDDPENKDDNDNAETKDQEDGVKKIWYADANIEDINLKDRSFHITPVWKEYKAYIRV